MEFAILHRGTYESVVILFHSTHLDDYVETCEEMYKKAPYLQFPLKASIYADFSENDLEEMMKLKITYSNMGSYAEPVTPSKKEFDSAIPSRDLSGTDHPDLIKYSTSNACATSWATATIAAAEKVLADRGTPVELSLEYLLDCYEEEMGESYCDGVSMADLSTFLSDRGLMSEVEAKRLGDRKCTDEFAHVFFFGSTRVEAPNRGGLMNLVASGEPTLSLMSLNLLRLRYTDNMDKDSEIPFTGSYGNPSVYGVVTGYGLDEEMASRTDLDSKDVVGWWMIDLAVTPFEHQQIKLPMRASETNANFGGIAAYAISIHYLDESPIRIESYESISDIPFFAKNLAFPADSFAKDELVDLSRFPNMESVSFGKGSFPNAHSFKAVNCPHLKKIVIEDGAFANASVFEVEQTSVEQLTIGTGCFNGAEISNPSRRLSTTTTSNENDSTSDSTSGLETIFSLINNPHVQNVYIPSGSFTYTKRVRISGNNAMESVVIEGEKGDKNAPFQYASSFIVNELLNLRNVVLGTKVCQACSAFSVDSPLIQNVSIGDFCFQGKDSTQQGNTAALQFQMVDKSELQSTSIGKGSFSFFNRYELKSML